MNNSECSYKNLFINNRAIMLIIDPETSDIEDCNISACSFYGYTYEEMLRLKITDINTLTEQQVVKEMSLAKAEQSHHFYFNHRLSNGQIRDVEVHSTPITFEGRLLLSSVIWDVTDCNIQSIKLKAENIVLDKVVSERTYQLEAAKSRLEQEILEHKRTEEALKYELSFTHALLENIQVGVIACDTEGKQFLSNKVAREWYGLDAMKQTWHDWSEYYTLLQADGVTPLKADDIPLSRAFKGEILKDVELAIHPRNQSVRYVKNNGCPLYSENGEILGAIVAITDITEQRKAEEALRILNSRLENEVSERTKQLEETNEIMIRQNEQREAVLENMSDALLIFDNDDNCTLFNKSARITFGPLMGYPQKLGDGFKRVEFYDMNDCLIPFEDTPGQRVKRGEKLVEYRMKTKVGNISIYTEGNGTPVYDKDGNYSAGILCCRDITEKVHLERSLKESETKFKDLFNNMQLGQVQYKIITDDFGKPIDYFVMEINPAYERITQLKRSEIIGKTATKLFPGIEKSSVNWIGIFGEVALTGKSISMEVYSDITNRWYDTFCYCPKPGYTAGIFSDITDRKNNEEELKKTKERLEEAQEFAHLGYWDLNTTNRELSWSDELFRIYGFRPQEFIPTINDFVKIIHPEDKAFMATVMNQPLKSNNEFDIRIVRHDNKIIWIHQKVKVEYNASGKLVRTYGVVQDITRRKLSETKLIESEERFREIAENLDEVIWVRQNSHIVYINPAFEKVWGRTCQSLYDNPDSLFNSIHPEHKERFSQAHQEESYTSIGSFDEQYKIIRPDGSIRWIWSREFPIFNEMRKIIRRVGICEDITKIKDYEESLRLAIEVAKTANKAKSQFLANMSHEIRTPMNGILGMSQLLEMDLLAEQKEMATMIKTCGENLLTIINDILDLSKIEAGKVNLSREKFDINMLVNEVDNLIKPLVVRKGLEYKSHIDPEVKGHYIGDTGRLKQILFNLLGNSIKFTDRGTVELSIVKGKAYQDRVQLVFSINDTGIGIADDKIGQLFTYFTQGDDSVIKKYGGTGLGLAISKQLINMMDGEVSVKSKLGVGSNFIFTAIFKLNADTKEVQAIAKVDVTTMAIANTSVMLVEDDNVSGLLVKMLCERRNINLKIATSGMQAINILKDESFDIIFMDIQMPDISGYETTKIIRDMEKILNKHTPIIATTAFALLGDREKYMAAGMDDYMEKPINAETFYSIVEKHISPK